MWTDHETDILREFRSRPEHFPLSRRIVRIGANKKNRCRGMAGVGLQHVVNDSLFAPGRDHDRERALRLFEQRLFR